MCIIQKDHFLVLFNVRLFSLFFKQIFFFSSFLFKKPAHSGLEPFELFCIAVKELGPRLDRYAVSHSGGQALREFSVVHSSAKLSNFSFSIFKGTPRKDRDCSSIRPFQHVARGGQIGSLLCQHIPDKFTAQPRNHGRMVLCLLHNSARYVVCQILA